MQRALRIISFLVLIFSSVSFLQAQDRSNMGREFWVGYGHNVLFGADNPPNAQTMVLYLSAEQATTATVSINGTAWSQTVSIPANSIDVTVVIPKLGANDARILTEGKSTKGIHIVSGQPIVVYAHQYGIQSSAATMLFPVETYGYSYYSMNYTQLSNFPNSYSWTFAVAAEDNTALEIIPSDTTNSGWLPGQKYNVTLQKGEIFNVFGKQTGTYTSKDLTGTKITSVVGGDGKCHPIGVFSGSSRVVICSGDGGEFMWQQMFPASAWGSSYLTYHTINNTSTNVNTPYLNFYRVAVSDPNTEVKRNGTVLTGLQKNFYYEFTSTSGDYIEADKPIFVTQYMPSSNQCTGTANPPNGDPEMYILSPIQQGIKKAIFYNTRNQNISINYADLIIHKNGVASLRMDGTPFAASSIVAHPNNPDYVFAARRMLGAGSQHTIVSDSAFTAKIYGLGSFESYGYLAGTLLNNLNAIGSIKNEYDQTNNPNLFTCPKTPFFPTISVAYKLTSLQWQLSKLSTVLSPNADITISNPVPVDSTVVFGRKYYSYRLSQALQFSVADTFYIPVKYTSPEIDRCDQSEEVTIEVIVRKGPTADFTVNYSGCPSDTALLTGTGVGNGLNINRYRWIYLGQTDSAQNASGRFLAGVTPVDYRVITEEGCVHDTTKPVVAFVGPEANFASTSGVCLGDSIRITDASTATTGTTLVRWQWDFGDGTSVVKTNKNPFYHRYADTGLYTISLQVENNTGCKSDTFSLAAYTGQRPKASFTTVGLPCSGDSIALQSTSSFGGGNLQQWIWDLNGTRVTNTNANALKVAYNYPLNNVVIRHWVNAVAGCLSDTFSLAPFNIAPKPNAAFSFRPDSLCTTYPILFTSTTSIAAGSIASYLWTFGDNGTSPLANPTHTYTTAGPYTINFGVVSDKGCITKASSQSMVISLKPQIDAGANLTVLLGKSIALQASSNGNFLYNWTPATFLDNASILKPITTPTASITYMLMAQNAGSDCKSTDTVRVNVLIGIKIPNAFSPNGDGINDVWNIAGLSDYTNAELKIFDRYGQNVFNTKGYNTPWDGSKNGKPLPTGLYYYILSLNDGIAKPSNGNVMVVR